MDREQGKKKRTRCLHEKRETEMNMGRQTRMVDCILHLKKD